jgi:hypothetical protein
MLELTVFYVEKRKDLKPGYYFYIVPAPVTCVILMPTHTLVTSTIAS